MAPRANWKGFLRLSLVTCPVALYPATSDTEKVSFNQINRKTGHRIKYLKVDAETGDEVTSEDMVDLARHIVEKKSGAFEPELFEDHYETALIDLINKKRSGAPIATKAAPKTGGNVINLMDALKKSIANEKDAAPAAKTAVNAA